MPIISMRRLKGRIRLSGKDTLIKLLVGAVALVLFLVAWQLFADSANTEYLPTPIEVLNAFVDSFSTKDPSSGVTMGKSIESSLSRFILGTFLAIGLAIPLGLAMGFFPLANAFGKPLIEIFRPIPPIAWVPFLFIVAGVIWGPVITIFLGVFFPVLSNVMFGASSVEPQLIDAAKTMGARKPTLFMRVVMPYTIPYLMTGIRIGLGIGWMCIVAAEMIGTRGGGVGAFILNNANIGRYDYMFAGMVMIAILGIVTVESASYIERRVSRWMGAKR
jgi:NitT/TauT family transport system permease protein